MTLHLDHCVVGPNRVFCLAKWWNMPTYNVQMHGMADIVGLSGALQVTVIVCEPKWQ